MLSVGGGAQVNNSEAIRKDMLRRIEVFKQKAEHRAQLPSSLEEARLQLQSRHETPNTALEWRGHAAADDAASGWDW